MSERVAWILACLLCAGAAANDTAEIDDMAARLQYAFHTADVRALEQAIAAAERQLESGLPAGLKEYYLAFGHWKLAQLHADGQADRPKSDLRSRASAAARTCIRQARAAVELDPHSADAYAVVAACTYLSQDLRVIGGLRESAGACRRDSALRTALRLEPGNPRVLFVEALCMHERSAAADVASFDKLRAVVAAFAAAAPPPPGQPDWGQPEALVLLAQRHLQQGDPVAARDAVERALVLAPDYRKAQDLLQVAGRRPP